MLCFRLFPRRRLFSKDLPKLPNFLFSIYTAKDSFMFLRNTMNYSCRILRKIHLRLRHPTSRNIQSAWSFTKLCIEKMAKNEMSLLCHNLAEISTSNGWNFLFRYAKLTHLSGYCLSGWITYAMSQGRDGEARISVGCDCMRHSLFRRTNLGVRDRSFESFVGVFLESDLNLGPSPLIEFRTWVLKLPLVL